MSDPSKARRGAVLRVYDMIQSIHYIQSYTEGQNLDVFKVDRLTQDAVIRNIEIIGEAAKHIPDDVCALAPAIAWRDVKAIRDVIAHNYFGVKVETIWAVVHEELPILLPLLEALYKDIKKENAE